MKKNFLIFSLLLVLFLPLFFAFTSKVSAVQCLGDCFDDHGIPRCQEAGCGECPGCQTPDPVDPNWWNSIHNPVLSSNWMKGSTFLQKFFNVFISLVFAVGGIIFFFMLVSGGIKWIGSSGEKGKLEEAQKQITSALVGLVILLLAFAIIKLIESLFGISMLNIKIPTLE